MSSKVKGFNTSLTGGMCNTHAPRYFRGICYVLRIYESLVSRDDWFLEDRPHLSRGAAEAAILASCHLETPATPFTLAFVAVSCVLMSVRVVGFSYQAIYDKCTSLRCLLPRKSRDYRVLDRDYLHRDIVIPRPSACMLAWILI